MPFSEQNLIRKSDRFEVRADGKQKILFTELYHHLLADIHRELALNERHETARRINDSLDV